MRRRRGFTLIELVVVMLLLVLVSAAVFIMAGTGSQTYLRLAARQTAAADLRTGLSYLDVQIRKHDTRQCLSLQPDPFAGQTSLVIEQNIEGTAYQTWIYVLDGYLCELFVAKDADVTPEMGSKIAPIDSLQLEMPSSDSIRIVLTRQMAGQAQQQVSRIIYLKAGGITS